MIEIVNVNNNSETVKMSEMKPGQIGIIVDHNYNGEYVMRTFSQHHFEVMMLNCNDGWSTRNDIRVRLFGPGESIVVKLSND